jgi:hypothetical protein
MQAEATIEPSRLTIDYPDRELNRLTTFFRLFVAIPIMIVLGTVAGGVWEWSYDNGQEAAAAAGGVLFFGPLLMILFRQKYPRWWFDFNLQLVRFSTRVWSYLALMSDRYPSTEEEQWGFFSERIFGVNRRELLEADLKRVESEGDRGAHAASSLSRRP